MFIVSKKNFKVKRADGSFYFIRKDYIGDIPADVAGSYLVQAAIKGGSIIATKGKTDKDLEAAEEAAKKAKADKNAKGKSKGEANAGSDKDKGADSDAEKDKQ